MRPTLANGVILAALLLSQPLAQAQLSPNCKRNGKRDYCALTVGVKAADGQQTVDKITFADHTVYEVFRNEASCKTLSTTVRTCNATIKRAGQSQILPAFYRGTAYEGGYQHEYVGRGIHLSYSYLD